MTDFEFNQIFLGDRCAEVLHRYEVCPGYWHVCTIDINNHYSDKYYRLKDDVFQLVTKEKAQEAVFAWKSEGGDS